jgi:hypothetical protein
MIEGLRGSVGAAATPFTKGPYTWGINVGGIPASTEVRTLALEAEGTLASGSGLVGYNITTTTAGTAGSWACGIYAKVVQGTTKNVNGYLDAAEFEVVNTCATVSDWFVVSLQANSVANGSHSSFIALRDYGSTPCQSMMWLGPEITAGVDGDTTSLIAATVGTTNNYTIRVLYHDTPLWIMCSNAQT